MASSFGNGINRRTRRTLTLASSRDSGNGYLRDKHDTRFVITDQRNLISDNTKQEIQQILQGEERKGNNVRNGKLIHGTIGITTAELLTIAQIIISSTKKGMFHKLTKKSNINLSSANSNQMSDVSSRQVLKNITKLNIADPKIMMSLKQCVYFLQGILNESRNFVSSHINCKLRLTTSQEVSPEQIADELRKLGFDSEA